MLSSRSLKPESRSRSLRKRSRKDHKSDPGPPRRGPGWAATVTSLTAIGALIFTGVSVNQSKNQLKISEQGLITDRYAKSIEYLGSSSLDIRLGGIYALERLAEDSPRDRETIIEVLAAFVRGHARGKADFTEQFRDAGYAGRRTDIDAVFRVLGRIGREHEMAVDISGIYLPGTLLRNVTIRNIDLRGSFLQWTDFGKAHLAQTNLTDVSLIWSTFDQTQLPGVVLDGATARNTYFLRANLSKAKIRQADFPHAGFIESNLAGAEMHDSSFHHTDFSDANLSGADLSHSDLASAKFVGANLTGANLTGANLSRANMRQANLEGAILVDTGGANFKGALNCNKPGCEQVPSKK